MAAAVPGVFFRVGAHGVEPRALPAMCVTGRIGALAMGRTPIDGCVRRIGLRVVVRRPEATLRALFPAWAPLLAPFDDVVAAVAAGALPLATELAAGRAPGWEGKSLVFLTRARPGCAAMATPTCGTAHDTALCARINLAQYLIETGDDDARYAAFQFQLMHAERYAWTAARRGPPPAVNWTGAVQAGHLPSIAPMLGAAGVFRIDRRPDDPFSAAIGELLRKAMPRICMCRSLWTVFKKICKNVPSVLHFALDTILVFLGGAFRGARPMHFDQWLVLRRWLGAVAVADMATQNAWIERHYMLIHTTLRAYASYAMRPLTGIDEVANAVYRDADGVPTPGALRDGLYAMLDTLRRTFMSHDVSDPDLAAAPFSDFAADVALLMLKLEQVADIDKLVLLRLKRRIPDVVFFSLLAAKATSSLRSILNLPTIAAEAGLRAGAPEEPEAAEEPEEEEYSDAEEEAPRRRRKRKVDDELETDTEEVKLKAAVPSYAKRKKELAGQKRLIDVMLSLSEMDNAEERIRRAADAVRATRPVAEVVAAASRDAALKRAINDAVDFALRHPGCGYDMAMMLPFVGAEVVNQLKMIFALDGDVAKNYIEKRVKEFVLAYPREMAVVAMYAVAHVERSAQYIVPLPLHVAVAQGRALRRLLRAVPGKELPEFSTCIFLCTSCGVVTKLYDPMAPLTARPGVCSHGVNMTTTGRLACSGKHHTEEGRLIAAPAVGAIVVYGTTAATACATTGVFTRLPPTLGRAPTAWAGPVAGARTIKGTALPPLNAASIAGGMSAPFRARALAVARAVKLDPGLGKTRLCAVCYSLGEHGTELTMREGDRAIVARLCALCAAQYGYFRRNWGRFDVTAVEELRGYIGSARQRTDHTNALRFAKIKSRRMIRR